MNARVPANRVRRRGPFAPLSAHYYKDDAILRAGEKAEVLWCRGLAFQSEQLRDGLITDAQLDLIAVGLTAVKSRARRLCEVGVWERVEGGYNIRAWLRWNQSREEIDQAVERDARRKTPREDDPPPPPTNGHRPRGEQDSGRNDDGIPSGNGSGFRAESESLAGAPPRAQSRSRSRSRSTSTSRCSSAGAVSGGESRAVGDDRRPDPPRAERPNDQSSPCGLHPDDDRPCRRCRGRRLSTEQANRDDHRAVVVASLPARRCRMCDGEEGLLEVGRFVPVSPWTRCDHETDHELQVARAMEAS